MYKTLQNNISKLVKKD